MKTLTPEDDNFNKTLIQICELMPKMRFIAKDIYKIQRLSQGLRFLNAKDEQVAAIKHTTLEQAQEDYNATFRN